MNEISYSQVHVFFAFFRGLGSDGLFINPWRKPISFDDNSETQYRPAGGFLQYLDWNDMASFLKVNI